MQLIVLRETTTRVASAVAEISLRIERIQTHWYSINYLHHFFYVYSSRLPCTCSRPLPSHIQSNRHLLRVTDQRCDENICDRQRNSTSIMWPCLDHDALLLYAFFRKLFPPSCCLSQFSSVGWKERNSVFEYIIRSQWEWDGRMKWSVGLCEQNNHHRNCILRNATPLSFGLITLDSSLANSPVLEYNYS